MDLRAIVLLVIVFLSILMLAFRGLLSDAMASLIDAVIKNASPLSAISFQ